MSGALHLVPTEGERLVCGRDRVCLDAFVRFYPGDTPASCPKDCRWREPPEVERSGVYSRTQATG